MAIGSKAREQYKSGIKRKTNSYRSPNKMASTASNNTRADIHNRVMTGSSLGKTKQDFKNISMRKATGSNMKRKTIRETSDFDLQMGDWGRTNARAKTTLGRKIKLSQRKPKKG